jgi:hypothetical protein
LKLCYILLDKLFESHSVLFPPYGTSPKVICRTDASACILLVSKHVLRTSVRHIDQPKASDVASASSREYEVDEPVSRSISAVGRVSGRDPPRTHGVKLKMNIYRICTQYQGCTV